MNAFDKFLFGPIGAALVYGFCGLTFALGIAALVMSMFGGMGYLPHPDGKKAFEVRHENSMPMHQDSNRRRFGRGFVKE